MNSHSRIHWQRLVLGLVSTVFFMAGSSDAAPKKRTREPLDTGFERKLGVVYKTVGEHELEFDVYYPKSGTKKPCPVIVYTHGGGWAAGSRLGAASGGFAPLFKQLTKAGFQPVFAGG